jgi:Putative Ig domain
MSIIHGTFGGTLPMTLSVSALPSGVTFADQGNGDFAVMGTWPVAAGTYNYTVTATNAGGSVSVPLNELISTAAGGFMVTGGDTTSTQYDTHLGAGMYTVVLPAFTAGTVAGGTLPYSFLWQYVSGDGFTINSPTSVTTTAGTGITVAVGQIVTKTGVYRCRITDGASTIIYGPDVTLTATVEEIT